jgi:hypothetical protein
MDDQVARVVVTRMKLRERILHDVGATPSIAPEKMAEWSPAFMTVYLIAANVRASLFEDLSQSQKNRGLRVTVSC